jgi:hypothetical protein
MSDVVEQVIQRHPEVKNEGMPEGQLNMLANPFWIFKDLLRKALS